MSMSIGKWFLAVFVSWVVQMLLIVAVMVSLWPHVVQEKKKSETKDVWKGEDACMRVHKSRWGDRG